MLGKTTKANALDLGHLEQPDVAVMDGSKPTHAGGFAGGTRYAPPQHLNRREMFFVLSERLVRSSELALAWHYLR